jgi:hypothetical protein
MGSLDDKGKEKLGTEALEDRKVEQKVDRLGQRERGKRDLVTGKKPEGRNPGQQRDND